jgi:DNA polymerase III subunit epsilon
MREIILDTETTGLDPAKGDRLVEIGCIETLNQIPTGRDFHRYVDPKRAMSEDAFRVHGLSTEFLAGKPEFHEVASEFLAFLGEARLVIHNAEFDMRFINAELTRAGHPPIGNERVIDTLAIARRKFPGAPASLDALADRFQIDRTRRDKHGALIDALILSEVYLELSGGRQASLSLAPAAAARRRGGAPDPGRVKPLALPSRLTEAERAAHAAFVATLGETAIWKDYV